MDQQGIRRLLVLSGSSEWSQQQASAIYSLLGCGLWLGDSSPAAAEVIPFSAAKTLLGQERLHGFLMRLRN